MFFAWAKRWRARAEQFSCFASNWHPALCGVAAVVAMGCLSNVTSGGDPMLAWPLMILSLSDGGPDQCPRPIGPTYALRPKGMAKKEGMDLDN
jgi:hypothetical protein